MNKKVIDLLNKARASELTAISQYMAHHYQLDDSDFGKLAKVLKKTAIDEMKHAEKHIGRILFLEGTPIVSKLNPIRVGADVPAQFKNDWTAENGAIKAYNKGIRQAVELGDNGTRELLESILKDEEVHIDWLEAQLDQIRQMGLQNYLVEQVG